jgi:hypothetical protein
MNIIIIDSLKQISGNYNGTGCYACPISLGAECFIHAFI